MPVSLFEAALLLRLSRSSMVGVDVYNHLKVQARFQCVQLSTVLFLHLSASFGCIAFQSASSAIIVGREQVPMTTTTTPDDATADRASKADPHIPHTRLPEQGRARPAG